jgi:hypothetical protein
MDDDDCTGELFEIPLLAEMDIAEAYRVVLRRAPDPEALDSLLNSRQTVHTLYINLLNSDEYNELKRKDVHESHFAYRGPSRRWRQTTKHSVKILCFGAYGNGNLGDAIQPSYVAKILRAMLPDVDLDIYATSWLENRPYSAPDCEIVPSWALFNSWFLSKIDFVVFGGGGITGPFHYPLTEMYWIDRFLRLRIPYGFLGIGVMNTAAQSVAFRKLVTWAAFTTSRTVNGVKQLAEADPTSRPVLFPDPVLLSIALERLQSPPVAGRIPSEPPKGLLLIKRPDNPEQKDFFALAQSLDASGANVEFMVFEPHLEMQHVSEFNKRVHIAATEDEFHTILPDFDYIISSRYHGCILAFKHKLPIFGIGEDKILRVLGDVGLREHYVDAAQADEIVNAFENGSSDRFRAAASFDEVARYYEVARSYIEPALRRALGLPSLTGR